MTRHEDVKVPVVCIGSVVAGGAGKTPVAIALGEALAQRGRHPHFLSRGYGGTLAGPVRVDRAKHPAYQVGDEPLLLAAVAPTWVARDRAAGARAAANEGAGVILMDDGFQNGALRKDISLLVVDGGYGFGNGRVMPAGPLREPVEEALARADAVIVIGEDTSGAGARIGTAAPVLTARFVPRPDAERVAGRRVLAFAGIGRPAKFFETLAGMGCEIVDAVPFPDHHRYTEDEVMGLVEAAAAADAVPVTTEKDAVRLPPSAEGMVEPVRVALEWGDPAAFERLVEAIRREPGSPDRKV